MASGGGASDPGPNARMGRRGVLRMAAATAAAVAAGPVLTACAQQQAPAATVAPQTAQPVETIHFQINWQQSWNKTAIALCQQFTDQEFNSKHKGVRAVPQSWGGAQGMLAAALAGSKSVPAVLSSCCGDFAIAQPMLAKLNPLLQQDNINPSIWSQGQLVTYEMPGGLYGVPAYTACQPLIYNQDVFDQLGLAYPDPAWTYKDATSIWQKLVSDKGGIHRYATTFQFYPNNFDGSAFLVKGFGGELMDATKTVCLLDQPGSLAAANWIYPQIWNKVIINRFGIPGMNGATALARGHSVMYQSAGNMLFEAVQVLGSGVKWDVLPMPAWPVRRGTNVQVDYYGLNAQYPNQALAWELFKFVAASQATNRFLIKTTLSFPNLTSMWDEWELLVKSAAPVTANKSLQYWKEAAVQGYGYGHEFFRYSANTAMNLMSPTLQKMWNHQMDPAEGYPLIAQQVTAFEKTAAKESFAKSGATKAFPVTGAQIAVVQPGL